jgi:hypothetical protein
MVLNRSCPAVSHCARILIQPRRNEEKAKRYNLQLDRLALELYRANLEVDADGRDVGFGVGVVGEAEEQAGLAHARVCAKPA